MISAVFLDRDGVINRSIVRNGRPHSPRELACVEILPGVADAIRRLRAAGFMTIAVTNQPDVARGTASRESVEAINRMIAQSLDLDEVMTCFHDDGDACDCRKPRPGHFFRARDCYGLDLTSSFMVGDRWRDIQAAYNAGCRSIFIDYGYSEPFAAPEPHFTCASLAEAAAWILEQRGTFHEQSTEELR
jgi:D-glycero-D-manno-heptose 1,7-bisphosphate phosphatase